MSKNPTTILTRSVTGATPVTAITATAQYTGTVAWSPAVSSTFAASTAYTATITLTAKAGFTLTGVAANSFTVAGATATNPVNSGVVTAVFPATRAAPDTVINIAAIAGVTAPVTGATPVTAITATEQYTGTVAWSGTPATFAAMTAYTATITLTAKTGYTLTGVAVNSLTVAGATATNPVNSGVITAVFPATANHDIVLKAVQGGTFNNGTANMTVSSFRMSQHEITGDQYAAVMGVTDPSYFVSVSNNPVEQVSWYDAVEFCNKLSTLDLLTPVYTITGRTLATDDPITSATVTANWSANGYRLPTEAEWQFAARGGNNSNNYTYAGSDTINDVAWYTSNSGSTTNPVGGQAANELGLYDMSGNVWEWNWDWYDFYYPTEPQTDYRGAASGSYRVLRGGSWRSSASSCTEADHRNNFSPDYRHDHIGFRGVRP